MGQYSILYMSTFLTFFLRTLTASVAPPFLCLIPFLSLLLNIFQTHRSATDTIAWVSLSSPMRASTRFWSQNSTYFPAGPKIIVEKKLFFFIAMNYILMVKRNYLAH